MRTSLPLSRLALSLLLGLAMGVAAVPAVSQAAEPLPPPRTEVEAAARAVVEPVERRLVVRGETGTYDVWLVSGLDFDQAVESARRAISSKQRFGQGFFIERWTWLEPDRSYLVDLGGGTRPWRMRLTRHLTGSLLEVLGAGEAAEAPRWTPPYRPRPVLLTHGPVR